MKPFELKIIDSQTPMMSDPFYAWLGTYSKRNIPKNPIQVYLESLGFVVGQDQITPEQYKLLEYILDHFLRCSPETQEELSLSELFTDATGPSSYYVQGMEGRKAPTAKLLDLLKGSGWIYSPHPENTYFEVYEDKVFAKYHQLLGSRFLCRLKKAPKITARGRKWFDKVNGNTYFSALVSIGEDTFFTVPFQYGYGDQWKWAVREQLIAQGFVPDPGHYENGNRKGSVSDLDITWIDEGTTLKRFMFKD